MSPTAFGGSLSSWNSAVVKLSRARPLLGTLVTISAEGDRRDVEGGVVRAFQAVEKVQNRMSYFNPTSDVFRLNREAFDSPMTVHADTYRVLQEAQRFSHFSEGAFDVTVGGALALGGFLPSFSGNPRPHPRAHYKDIELGPARSVRFRRPLWIDLGGIAKGFAVDQALAELRRSKVKRGWVNAGGDLAFFSDRPEPLWVRHPTQGGEMISLGPVRQGALASSAPAYRSQPGGRSPYVCRGKWIRSNKSVTVAAPCALWADGLTKVALLAPEKTVDIAREFRAGVRVLSDCSPGVCLSV
jgi:thiamine biosynthesis lipoprotein